MNTTLLINAIVRQTTVLIASLATASGHRAQLAAVANQIFADLVRELREQGLGNKVIADMFGLALRTYHRKLAKLSASRSVLGRSLWEAVFSHIQQHGPLTRRELFTRFARDDEASVASVLLDLIESGLVLQRGSGDGQQLSAAETLPGDAQSQTNLGQLDNLLLVALHRDGPRSANQLGAVMPVAAAELEAALNRLVAAGLVNQAADGGEVRYACESLVIAFGEGSGWEAAVFDHYQALVSALVTKLRAGTRRADLGDAVGGSTFTFDLWHGHPMQGEVLGYLRAMRERGMQLRSALQQYNDSCEPPPAATPLRVTAYVGQGVTDDETPDV